MAYVDVVRRVSVRRLARLRGLMDAEGLSGLLLFEGDFVACKLTAMRHFNAVLVTRDNTYVLVDPSLQHEALREGSWGGVDVVVVENFCLSELVRRVESLLPRRGSVVRLGVNKAWGRGRLTFLYADLLDALRSRSVEVVDATPVLAEVFDKPYEEELSVIRWVSEAASRALEAVREGLEPGVRECGLASLADKVLDEAGITDRWFPTIVASGARAAAPHAKTTARRVGYGEPVVVDVGPLWMGYDGCVAHTFIAGRSGFWEGVVEGVASAIREGLRHVRPGTPVRTLDEIPRRELDARGLPNYPHLTGHPVGGFYKPVIAGFIGYALETNMTFAYEPAAYLPGKGGVRIEPHVLVTGEGHEVLTPIHKELLR